MMVKVKINGIEVEVENGTKILHAAKKAGYWIPSLCYHPDLPPSGNCGVCVVEADGRIVRACTTPVYDGMEVKTEGRDFDVIRKAAVELILYSHPNNCVECHKNGSCELQDLAQKLHIHVSQTDHKPRPVTTRDTSSSAITLDPGYCIQCGRCVHVCNEIQAVHALAESNRGFETFVGPTNGRSLDESECVKCGQCSAYCPVAAIYETEDMDKLMLALDNPEKIVVAQEAPAVRVALGEEFGYEPGTNVVGKMYTALRRLGVNYVFDTNFGADLTIMEEASEFVKIFKESPNEFPLITSCCPAWVDFLEKFYIDMIDNFSTAKSPHQMVGTMVKTYWAEKMNVDPKDIFLVSVMPCTAKKYEIDRMEDMYASGHKDVDLTITTRELARLIRMRGIDFPNLPEGKADNPMGEYSGAGTIFGSTGGVMEAALRTAYKLITDEELPQPEIELVRGFRGIRHGSLEIAGNTVNVAVASGLGNVTKLLEEVRQARKEGKPTPYHFIEVMACQNGCVGGGGQPYGSSNEVRIKRAKGLYKEDSECAVRESHNNPSIQKLYKEFLGEPLSEKSHHLLHTKYIPRPVKLTGK